MHIQRPSTSPSPAQIAPRLAPPLPSLESTEVCSDQLVLSEEAFEEKLSIQQRSLRPGLEDYRPRTSGQNEEWVNPSAELQQVCASLLLSLGQSPPADLDTRTGLSAYSANPRAEVLKIAGEGPLATQDCQPLLSQLQNKEQQARMDYGGHLPAKVEALLRQVQRALPSPSGADPGRDTRRT